MDKNEDYNFESLSGTANFDEVIQTKLTEWLMLYSQQTTASIVRENSWLFSLLAVAKRPYSGEEQGETAVFAGYTTAVINTIQFAPRAQLVKASGGRPVELNKQNKTKQKWKKAYIGTPGLVIMIMLSCLDVSLRWWLLSSF